MALPKAFYTYECLPKAQAREWLLKWLLEYGIEAFRKHPTPARTLANGMTVLEDPYDPASEVYALKALVSMGLLDTSESMVNWSRAFRISKKGLDFLKEDV